MPKFPDNEPQSQDIEISGKDLLIGALALAAINLFVFLTPEMGWQFANRDAWKVVQFFTIVADAGLVSIGLASILNKSVQ